MQKSLCSCYKYVTIFVLFDNNATALKHFSWENQSLIVFYAYYKNKGVSKSRLHIRTLPANEFHASVTIILFLTHKPFKGAVVRMGSPKIHMLKPTPLGDGIRKWGLWEAIRSQGQSLPE